MMLIKSFVFAIATTLLSSASVYALDSVYIKGSAGVDQYGGSKYSIPLETPPGVAGLKPNLYLEYSSHGQNGYVGVGWSVSGMSAISRCPATNPQDGYVQGINFDGFDRFCLDGVRLFAVGTNEYRTEIETYERIFSYGTAGSGPSYFVAYTKDGTKYTFGNTTDSKILAQSNPNVAVWALDQVTDINQNYYQIKYINDPVGGQYYPDEIDYTGNSSQSTLPLSKVKFSYEARPDVYPIFRANINLNPTNRLTNITTYVNNLKVLDYQLAYNLSGQTSRSLLTSVNVQSGDQTMSLLPTTFAWNESGSTYKTAVGAPNLTMPAGVTPTVTSTNGGILSGSASWYAGDFNGDGISDVIEVAGGDNTARVCYNSYGGTTLSCTYYVLSMTLPVGNIIVGDFNGDGLADFADLDGTNNVVICYSQFTGGFSCVNMSAPGMSTYAGTITQGLVVPGQGFPIGGYYAVDMNGDGIADIVQIPSITAPPEICFMLSSPGSGSCGRSSALNDFSAVDVMIGDFDGDGRQDIAYQVNNPNFPHTSSDPVIHGKIRFCYSGATGPQTCEDKTVPTYPFGYSCPSGYCWDHYFTGDFNGDGQTDIAFINGTSIFISFSTGRGVALNMQAHFIVNPAAAVTPFFVGDLNGDGKADIVTKDSSGHTEICYSRGNGDFDCVAGPTIADAKTAFGNFTGDSTLSILGGDATGSIFKAYNNPMTLPDTIRTISNGLGGSENFSYAPLTAGVHTKSSGSIYPLQDAQSQMWVVSKKIDSTGSGLNHEVHYAYAGAKNDLSGRGFLGFSTVTENDVTAHTNVTTYSNQIFPFTGRPSSILKSALDDDGGEYQVVSQSYFKYIYKNSNLVNPFMGSPTQVLLTDKQDVSYDLNSGALLTNASSHFEYDDYENPVLTTSNTDDGYSTQAVITYNNSLGDPSSNQVNWFLGQVSRVAQTKYKANGKAITKTKAMTYDSNHEVTQVKEEPDSLTNYRITDYAYDNFGNLASKTFSGNNLPARVEHITYDSNGQFPTSTSNAYGHTMYYNFDPNFGQVTSTIDPNSLSVQLIYDSLGRATQEIDPDGVKSSISYNLCGSLNCRQGQAYFIKSSRAGGNVSLIYSDAFDRNVLSQVGGFNGEWIYKYTNYDSIGNIISTSKSAKKQPKYYYNYFYDSLNRITKAIAPDKSEGNIAYLGLTTVTTDANGRSKTKEKNSIGELTLIKDDVGNSLRYVYDADRNPIKTTDPKGNTINFTYDIFDRKLTQSDKNGGTWSYSYNAAGEVLSSIDAKGNVISTTFDNLGRPLAQITTEGISSWVYDSALHGIGKIASESRDNGYSKSYTYDSLGRIANNQSSLDTAYNISNSYDVLGRVSQTTYPSGFSVKYKYDSNGFISEVDNAATSALIWKLNAADADGMYLSESFGNGIKSDKTYYPETGLLHTTVATTSSGSAIQNITLAYDLVGNLTSRDELSDSTSGAVVSETYAYDHLNRLVSVNGPTSKNFSYDDVGNITNKSDVGSFTYGTGSSGSPVHGVVSTVGPKNLSFTYDADGNMLTGNGRTFTWTSFNKPTSISNASNTINFSYDARLERFKEIETTCKDYLGNTSSTCAKYLINPGQGTGIHYEKEVTGSIISNRHFIYAGSNNVVAVYTTRSDGTTAMSYLHSDHLGGVSLVTDQSGNVTERFSYDAFGKRRFTDASDDSSNSINGKTSHQGYTFHEHLDDGAMGLVHMNGRVYEPTIGRFASVDSQVTDTSNLQTFNGYGYVTNNPMNGVDLNGYGCFLGACAGGDVGNLLGDASDVANDAASVVSSASNWISQNPSKAVGYALAITFPYQSAVLLNTTNAFQANFNFSAKDKNNVNAYYITMAAAGVAAVTAGGATELLGVSYLTEGAMFGAGIGAAAGSAYSYSKYGSIHADDVLTGAMLGAGIGMGSVSYTFLKYGTESMILGAAADGFEDWAHGNYSLGAFSHGFLRYFSSLKAPAQGFLMGGVIAEAVSPWIAYELGDSDANRISVIGIVINDLWPTIRDTEEGKKVGVIGGLPLALLLNWL